MNIGLVHQVIVMLTKIRIKNFKCFQDTGELDIRPLTFLVGPNSSGKSSLLKALLTLKQTVDSTDFQNALIANDKWIQLGAYPEFVYKGESMRNIDISMELTTPARFNKMEIPNYIKFNFSLRYNHKTTQIELEKSEIAAGKEYKLQIIRKKSRNEYYAKFTYKTNDEHKTLKYNNVFPLKFYNFVPSLKKGETYEEKLKERLPPRIYWTMSLIIEDVLRDFFYLGPLRDYPRRFYITSGQAPPDVGIRGERAIDVLWLSHRSDSKVEDEVRDWLKKFDIAQDIKLTRVRKGNYYIVNIVDPQTGTEVNIADIGFGASQTLPIIIESFYAPSDSVILIEQPEIHLHPKAQSILGDLFIKAVKEKNRTFIVETHSEHILSRVRRRIAERKIGTDNIAIYYFEPTPEGTKIQRVTINDQGQYESFPEGFFEEDVTEAFEHLKAISESTS